MSGPKPEAIAARRHPCTDKVDAGPDCDTGSPRYERGMLPYTTLQSENGGAPRYRAAASDPLQGSLYTCTDSMAKGVEVASTRYRFGDEPATPAEPNVKVVAPAGYAPATCPLSRGCSSE